MTKKEPITTFTFPSNDERQLYNEIAEDVKDMVEYARPAREKGRNAIQGYMAMALEPFRASNRSRIFPPTIHAMVYSRIAMEAANPPNVMYKARKLSSEPKMKFINAAKRNAEQGDGNLRPDSRHLWFHQNFDKVMFGVGFRYLSYLTQTRMNHVKDRQGKWREKKTVVYDDIWDEVPDFFNVGVSRDAQPGMFGATSCYLDRFYKKEAFEGAFNREPFMNLDKVPEQAWFDDGVETNTSVPEGFVRVRQYWNLAKDLYYVLANGVPIRTDYILDYGIDGKKFLPITSIHNDMGFDIGEGVEPFMGLGISGSSEVGGRIYSSNTRLGSHKSFWSKGDPHLVQSMIGLKNALWRSAADNIKAGSVHFLLSSNPGVIDQISTADLYGVVPIKTDASTFNVQSLMQNSNFLSQWQGMDQIIDNVMKFALGNDWERAAQELVNEKATVAAIRQQVQRVRLSYNTKFNESGGVKRHYMILLNLIQQYYPEPLMEDLVSEEIPEGTPEDDIIRDPDGHPVFLKKFKNIPFDEELVEVKSKGKFMLVNADHSLARDKDAEKSFRPRAEYIRLTEEPEIYIEPGSSFAELKALEKSMELEYVNAIQPFLGLVYPDEKGTPSPLIPREGVQEIVSNLARVWERDPDKIFGRAEEDTGKIPEPFNFENQSVPKVPRQVLVPGAPGSPSASPSQMASDIRQSVTP